MASWYVVPSPEAPEGGQDTGISSSEAMPAPPAGKSRALLPGIYIVLLNAGGAGRWQISQIMVNEKEHNGVRVFYKSNIIKPNLLNGEMWILDPEMMRLDESSKLKKPVRCEIPVRLYVWGWPERRLFKSSQPTRVEITGRLPSTLPYDWRSHDCDPSEAG